MKLGITGTRDGMTDAQAKSFRKLIIDLPPITDFAHGSCKGVDVQAARIVNELCILSIITCHPGPVDDPCQERSRVDDVRLPNMTHLARNRNIVATSDTLVVIPKDTEWQRPGGTWMTHDHAIKKGKEVIVIWPDGTIKYGPAPRTHEFIKGKWVAK